MSENLHPVIAFLDRISRISPEAAVSFEQAISFAPLPRNTQLLTIGSPATHMYYIHRGLARVYYHNNSTEITDYFAIDGQFIGAVPALFTGGPSKKAIHLLEDSEVYAFSAADFDRCCAMHHDLERAARKVAYFALAEEQQRIESMRFHSMAQRYEGLEKKYPGITTRCPLKYIATYLGTTQVSISRIRSGVQ